MKRGNLLYEGKAKKLFETEEPTQLLQFFKDDATAFNGVKKGIIVDKGKVNSDISSIIFQMLEKEGIKTHYKEKLSDNEMLVQKVEIIPVEVVIRNIVAGSLSKRMGVEEGTPLKDTLIEFYYKDDDLGDPMINENHIYIFDLAKEDEISFIKESALKINKLLVDFFASINIDLVDYKLEYGKFNNEILLADEISPDGCRLWEKSTGEKMDKDRFRHDLGKVEETYHEVWKRVMEKGE